MPEKPQVLVVMPAQDREWIEAELGSEFTVLGAANCAEARVSLHRDPAAAVVTALTLEDGNWWCIFEFLAQQGSAAETIVVLPKRGVNSSEIRAHGVLGVLGKPLDGDELRRLVHRAVRQAQEFHEATASGYAL